MYLEKEITRTDFSTDLQKFKPSIQIDIFIQIPYNSNLAYPKHLQKNRNNVKE